MRRILRHRIWVVVGFLMAAIMGCAMFFSVSINYQLASYLPDDAESTQALRLMESEFGALPNARVMVGNVSLEEALDWKTTIQDIDGVRGVIWLDDVLYGRDLESADEKTRSPYYQDGAALYSVVIATGREVATVDAISAVIGEDGSIAGDAVTTATQQKLTVSECLKAILILVPLILCILLLTTSSWLEPILFLLTIGVAVLINMGSNALTGEVSFITQAVSPILQLAVSLDYAIFLLHQFARYRQETPDLAEAMRLAVRRSAASIAASAATTVVGFLALVFMRFEIGPDLGWNLFKGVALSFVSVMLFLPCLTLISAKAIDRTKHRSFLTLPEKWANGILRVRIPILIIAALLIVPCYLMQDRVAFMYGIGEPDASTRLAYDADRINDTFGKSNTFVVLVPRGDVEKELALCQALRKLDGVTDVTAYATVAGTWLPPYLLDARLVANLYSDNYARILITTDLPDEGDEAFATVEQMRTTTAQYYDESYSCGQSVNLYDIRSVVLRDTRMVNLVALFGIAIVLLFAFRSLSLPVLLLAVIEAAIWINLSISYLSGSPLSYIGYLLVQTVQLGATIDYAILLTDHYRENRATMPKLDAMRKTIRENILQAATSATVLSLAGFCLVFASTNTLVKVMGMLLGRGTVLSFVMVACVLPGLLLLFDGLIQKTSLRIGVSRKRDAQKVGDSGR